MASEDNGNIVFPVSSTDSMHFMDEDEEEADTAAVYVDEDGNLRIRSARRSLGESNDANNQAEERREILNLYPSEQGTAEEQTHMLVMDTPQGERMETGLARSHSLSLGPGQDFEMTTLKCPAAAEGEESHWPATDVHSLERGETGHDERTIQSLSLGRLALIAAAVVIIIGIALTVSLVPASFVYVEYYELALTRNRVSGKVNRVDVYYPGCYLLTPDVELIRFSGTAHLFQKNLNVLTSDRLMFNMGISLQYFIKPEELGQLFTDYALNYVPVVESMIESTIHIATVGFSLDHIRLNRSYVEQTLRQAVAFKLSGDCCPSCCPNDCGKAVDCGSCLMIGQGCTKGIHMELKYFQLGAVDIPEDVSERFLRQTILLIEAEKEVFVQQHALETKKSEEMQKDILNQATEIREAAAAKAKKIRSISEAEYDKQVQTSYAAAWKKFYQRLNITQEDHKLSLMYIRALEGISDHLYNLNYNLLTTYN